MLKDIIDQRWSARDFESTPVEKEQLDYILHCATHAPSKQGVYNYEVHVITNNDKGKLLKKWLYWENTWCVDGSRNKLNAKDSRNKRFNPQVLAPLVLVWTDKNIYDCDISGDTLPGPEDTKKWGRRSSQDSTISASFAMLAAEELGLQTSFTACFDRKQLGKKLGRTSAHLILSVGTAMPVDPNKVDSNKQSVYDNSGIEVGRQQRNLGTDWPMSNHTPRSRSPKRETLIRSY